MKIRWTFPIAAFALAVGAFPAFASQNTGQSSTDRKIDAAARTPYVTKHQAANLKKAAGGANERVADEKLTNSEPAPAPETGAAPAEGQPGQAQQGQANTPPAEQKAPEPEKPKYRFMGTACGKGEDVAMFDNGSATPIFRRVGDTLEDGSQIVAIDRGCVSLVQTVPATKKGDSAKTRSFDLYNW